MIPIRREWSAMKRLALLSPALAVPLEDDTASGNPVVFQTDIAKPLKQLQVSFTPIQEGSGDPSPVNQRPIVPWDGLTVFGGGKNLLDETQLAEESGITYENGYYTGTRFAFHTAFSGGLPILPKFKENTRYTLSATGYNSEATSNTQFVITYTDGTQGILRFTEAEPTRKTITTTNGKTVANIAISYGDKSSIIFYVKDIQLEAGQTATAYEPYHPITETDIVFPSPVYGGEHEAVSGKLMNGWKVVDMGSLEWTYRSGDDNFTAPTPSDAFDMISSADIVNNFLCEAYKGVFSFVGNNVITMNNRSTGLTKLIRVRDQSFGEDAEAFTAFVTGKKLAYKLATPTEQTLTGHQLTAIVGDNTIWSDADGSMTAIYLKKK